MPENKQFSLRRWSLTRVWHHRANIIATTLWIYNWVRVFINPCLLDIESSLIFWHGPPVPDVSSCLSSDWLPCLLPSFEFLFILSGAATARSISKLYRVRELYSVHANQRFTDKEFTWDLSLSGCFFPGESIPGVEDSMGFESSSDPTLQAPAGSKPRVRGSSVCQTSVKRTGTN